MILAGQVRLLLCAVQFLTRAPTPPLRDFQPDWIARSTRYFPLVGLGVGALSGGVFMAARLVFSPFLAAALALAAGLVITGAFHEDGWVDAFDGLFGGLDPKGRLVIMKDSRIGTFGGFALAISLLLKIEALSALGPAQGALALVAAHAAGRAFSVAAMRLTPYAGDPAAAKWTGAAVRPTWSEVLTAFGFGLAPLLWLPPRQALLVVLVAGALALVMTALARRLIGGHTGDVLGAVEQAGEIGVLLALAARL